MQSSTINLEVTNAKNFRKGTWGDVLVGLGSLANPIYGITQGTIDSINDAKRVADELQKQSDQLKKQENDLQKQINDVNSKLSSAGSVKDSSEKLRNSVIVLRLDVSPNELWDDYLIDRESMIVDASNEIRDSIALSKA